MPFRPQLDQVHQSPGLDWDTVEQGPCCGPANILRLNLSLMKLGTKAVFLLLDAVSYKVTFEMLQRTCMPGCRCARVITFKLLFAFFEGIWLIITASTDDPMRLH